MCEYKKKIFIVLGLENIECRYIDKLVRSFLLLPRSVSLLERRDHFLVVLKYLFEFLNLLD